MLLLYECVHKGHVSQKMSYIQKLNFKFQNIYIVFFFQLQINITNINYIQLKPQHTKLDRVSLKYGAPKH